MRRRFQLFLGGRYQFSADVAKFSYRYTSEGLKPSMLLYDVALHTKTVIVTVGHCWVEVNSEVAQFNPQGGERICFYGTVEEYYKINGRGVERIDYTVGQLDNIDLVSRPYEDGLRFSDYWQNVKQSRAFRTWEGPRRGKDKSLLGKLKIWR